MLLVCSLSLLIQFLFLKQGGKGRLELVSPEGLRVDGRRHNEMRKIRSSLSVLSHADGSAYLEQGNTKCLVAVWGPRECRRRSDALTDRALINVEYKLATFASGERQRTRKGDRYRLFPISYGKAKGLKEPSDGCWKWRRVSSRLLKPRYRPLSFRGHRLISVYKSYRPTAVSLFARTVYRWRTKRRGK